MAEQEIEQGPDGITVEHWPGGCRIAIPRRGFRPWIGDWFAFLAALTSELLLLFVLLVAVASHTLPSIALGLFVGLFVAVPLPILGFWFHALLSHSTSNGSITCGEGRLSVEITRWCGVRTWVWNASDILVIRSRSALEVETARNKKRLLGFCTLTMRNWVAHRLRRELGLGPLRTDPEDVVVRYLHPYWQTFCDGLLHVEPGQFSLRNGYDEHARWHFQAGGAFKGVVARFAGHLLFCLEPSDVTCRVTENGNTCLRIHPSGNTFDLSIWCADPEALPRALERFWGAAV